MEKCTSIVLYIEVLVQYCTHIQYITCTNMTYHIMCFEIKCQKHFLICSVLYMILN